MERLEEFTRNGKNFIYIDLSKIQTNEEFLKVVEDSKAIIRRYGEHELYTVTNIAGVMFDTKTKRIAAEWTAHNRPYVKYGVIIGMDSIKKIMVNAVFALSRRKNMGFAATKEEAVEWLLQQK